MIKRTLLLLVIFMATGVTWLCYGPGGMLNPVNLNEDTAVVIDKGSSTETIANLLLKHGVIQNKYAFYAAVLVSGEKGHLRAGEFLIPAHATLLDVIRILCCGSVIVHNFTIPEGETVSQVIRRLKELPNLEGEIERLPKEGTLLPETYTYVYGESRQSLIHRMEEAMRQVLMELWEKRQEDLPIKSPEEALILASIVEKETSVARERPRIAGVFVNRLKIGMKLQSDPTVIYGLTHGKSRLGRSITRGDLKSETIFNTYVVDGLPPLPIACPGKAAIAAVLKPMKTKDLFFVANGRGG
ncbi:MAG TPA: endolytic transglycosylase MltG, partial [Candidatus Nitrosotenuis sp.]|nr:endolytic transglycosylase MltG [Candidatus Nitrosotenuis sp.]